jgi:hypothetical protein
MEYYLSEIHSQRRGWGSKLRLTTLGHSPTIDIVSYAESEQTVQTSSGMRNFGRGLVLLLNSRFFWSPVEQNGS